jgi:hypothetical protein
MRRALAAAACALLAGAACVASAPRAPENPAAPVPFLWPRAGTVTALACRFETAQPIGVALAGAAREDETAAHAVLRAWERAGLGFRFLEAPAADAQLTIAFRDEPLPDAGRSFSTCRMSGERAELAEAHVDLARVTEEGGRAARALTREELLGVLAREVGRALGATGGARPGDPVRVASLSDAARFGAEIQSGATLESPALAALYAAPSGRVLASVPAEPPAATRPVDRLAELAASRGLVGPYLRASGALGRVFWRDPRGGDEYGAQVVAPGGSGAPGRVAIALEPRARRALPRSGDAAPAPRAAPAEVDSRQR